MSPENAKVFIVEDNRLYADHYEKVLNEKGHQVVGRATTRRAAIEATKSFEEMGVQVVLIDGNLSEGDVSGYDGQVVLDATRKNAPTVKTVGMSSVRVPGTDLDLGKLKVEELGIEVTKL